MIYVITHKEFDFSILDSTYYRVLQVGQGKKCTGVELWDDTGENISKKNAYYCELTGLYWIWKNSLEEEDELTGLVHYRRFFTSKISYLVYQYFGIMPKNLSGNKIEKILKKYDIILPTPKATFKTINELYFIFHNGEDIEITRDAIKKVSPEYLSTFDKVMNMHHYFFGNMMICSRKLINTYSEWLFAILDEIETNIDIEKYDNEYQKRVFGFVAERLLQVWVIHNKLNIKTYSVFNTEERDESIFRRISKLVTRVILRM